LGANRLGASAAEFLRHYFVLLEMATGITSRSPKDRIKKVGRQVGGYGGARSPPA
jgi:hypothetical protein